MILHALWKSAVNAYNNSNPKKAERALKTLLNHPAANVDTFLLAGLVYGQLFDWKSARLHLQKAAQLDPNNSNCWLALGNAYHMSGKLEEAIHSFQKSCALDSNNPDAWNNMGVANEDMGRFRDALDHYNKALEQDPDHENALKSRASVMGRLRWLEPACHAYDDLLTRFPKDQSVVIDYAEFLEQANKPQQAQELISTLSTFDNKITDARANNVRAKVLIRNKSLQSALTCLEQTRKRTGEEFLSYSEGSILDKLGRYEEAMTAFKRANQYRAKQKNFRRVFAQQVNEYLDYKIDQGIPISQSDDTASDHRPIVFLTGLPRSGTTLLDRMLDAHPNIQVFEELEGLRMTETAMTEGATIEEARFIYYDFIERHVEIDDNKLIVDKNPIHIMYLDMIPKVFQSAKVILALRHPYDAALSCFMQDFDAGPVTARFHNLKTTGKLCQQFLQRMHQYEIARPALTYRVRYENLVTDFKNEITQALEFIGLQWDENIENYAQQAAQSNPIMTASYEQVTQKLYQSAVERWRNYEKWISPFDSTLKSQLANFDYTISDNT